MSKIITLILVLFSLNTFAQRSVRSRSHLDPKDYNKWDFAMATGLTFPRTDITGKAGSLGISFDFTRYLSSHFALQARILHANIQGQDINRPEYDYNTTINYDMTVNAVFQTTNFILFPEKMRNRLGLYASVGGGVIRYSPDIWLDNHQFKMHGIYTQYSQNQDTFDYRGSTDFVMPISFGAKIRMSGRVSLSLEYSYRITNTDKLDGYFTLLSNNDSYSFLSAGIAVHIGSKSKVLQWSDPNEQLYADFEGMRVRVETLRRDGDNDGVTDYFDKEPETPPGTRVYGDGTSVDTDRDGVVDRLDAEPFSSKNARVDVNGREVHAATPPPVVQPKVVVDTVTHTENYPVYFDYDKFRINTQFYEGLGKIAEVILSNQKTYRLIAICDDPKEYNLELSNKRTDAVKKHLMRYYKIKPERFTTEIQYVTRDPNLLEKNRRVEVREK